MSHFSTVKTQLRKKEFLKQALIDLGYVPNEGENLVRGYRGQTVKAQMIVEMSKGADVVRLEVEADIPERILKLLIESISIQKEYIYFCKSLLGLDDLNCLTKINRDDLKQNLLIGKTHPLLKLLDSTPNKNFNSIFKILRKQNILLHHPYDLFKTSVEEFINRAADDPLVMAIKITLYRVSQDSPIITAFKLGNS